MKKNKKILLSLLALNIILPVYKASASITANNYGKLYNVMQKNIDNGKSNSNTYKILEKALNKRNKELEDLYLQNDYIVKSEYLEWQIFFSGTYMQDARTGSISKNKSREGNEDKANWAGKDKPLTQVSGYKEIKIGPSIPYKYLNLQDINPNISLPFIEEVAEINLNKVPLVINLPQLPALPDIQLNTVAATNISDINIIKNIQVSPVNVNVTAKTFNTINTPNPDLGVNGNGYNDSSNSQNLNTNVDYRMSYPTTLLHNSSQSGLIQIIGPHGTKYGVPGLQPGGVVDNVTFEIRENLTTQRYKSRILLIESHRGNGGPVGPAGDVLLVKTTGTLEIDADNSIGVEIEQGYGPEPNDSVYINTGTIKSNKNSVMGIDFKAGPRGPLYAENHGNINLAGTGSVGIKSTHVNSNIQIGIVNTSTGIITLSGTGSVGIAAENGDFIPFNKSAGNFTGGSYTTGLRQEGTIDIKGISNVGMVIKSSGAKFTPEQSLNDSTGNIKLSGTKGVGIYLNYANNNNTFINNGNISILEDDENVGIRVDTGVIKNKDSGKIEITGTATNSTGILITSPNSIGINDALIEISSTGNGNIGLYGTGNGERIINSGNIHLNLTSGSENIGASVIGGGTIFNNTGTITLNDIGAIGKNIGIYSENGTTIHSGNVNVTAKGNDIGVYLKGASSGIIGGNISLTSSGNAYDYGIYYDSTYTGNAAIQSAISLSGKSAGVFSGNKDINFQGTIDMINSSDDSIGILYQGNSTVGNVTNNGTINAVKGTGIYFYDGNASSGVTGTVTNSSGRTIEVSEGGVGIVAESSGTYSPGKIINIVNNGTILNTANSTSNSIGIFAKNHDLKITGSGIINVESLSSENLGIYINGGTVDFESEINVGSQGIGVYLDGNQGNTNESVLNIGGTAGSMTSATNGIGIVAKGEKATVNILSNGITLNGSTATNGSLGVFIDDANVSNNGTIETGDKGTAAYLKDVSASRNINLGNLKTGNEGVGLYLEGHNSIDSLISITTGLNGIGIYNKGGMIDLDNFNLTTFNLGAGSTGYFLENSLLKSSNGSSSVNFGNDVTGVALTGSSSIDSSVESITIGDYSGGTGIAKPIALGIKDISVPLTLSTKLTGGNGTVGLYYKTDVTGNLLTYNGSGSLTAPDIKAGLAGGTLSSVGVYLETDSNVNALNLNNTYVRVDGKSGIALGAEKGNISVSGGKIELTEGGVLFLVKDGGSVDISPSTTIITPDSGVELFRVINADYTNSAGTTLEIPRESVAIHGESGVMINEGEMISKALVGTPADSSIGIYIENTKQTVSGILDLSNANSKGINRNLINLGNKGIGIFGENSTIENDSSGTIKIGSEGAGLYASIGSVLNNNGIIETGENSVGIYAIDRAGSPSYTGLTKENYINNQGQIISIGNNTTGISSTGSDLNIRSEITNSGDINLTGANTVGIYGERTNILNSGNIATGNGFVSGIGIEYAAGIIGNESNITIQNGHIQTGNYSIGAAAVGNSTLTINNGTIDVGENSIFNYIKKGTGSGITLTDTSGGIYNLDKNKQIGIYTEEGDVYSNKTLNISGTDSIGVYAKNNGNVDMLIQGLNLNIGEGQKGMFVKSTGTGKKVTLNNTVNLTGNNSLGIIQQEGNVEANGLININGAQSVGILSSNSNIVTGSKLLNNSDINVNGESGIGIYGTTMNNAQHEIINTGTISIGNSLSQDRVIMGIYGENGTTINNTGNINVGESSIALYGNNITVNQDGGTLNLAKSGLGVYLNGGTGIVNDTFMNISDGNAAGIYATNSGSITLSSTNVMNIGDTTGALTGNAVGSFGIVGKNNSIISNSAGLNVGLASIGVYVENSILHNTGNMIAAGTASNTKDGRVLIYGGKSEIGNIGSIITNAGNLNASDMGVGIYSNTGSITNTGEITVGNTYQNPLNSTDRQYAVGIYGTETSSIINSNKITFGSNGLGIYAYIPKGQIVNTNLITSSSSNGVGVYIEKGNMVSGVMQEFLNDSTGRIILSGENSIGIAGVDNVKIINNGLVEVTGKNSIGIYADTNSVVENNSTVRAMGVNGVGISLKNGSILINNGTIDIDLSNGGRAIVTDTTGSTSGTASISEIVDTGIMSPVDHVGSGPSYEKPSIVNAGIIKVNEKFEVPEDAIVQIKVDPSKLTPADQATSDYHPEDVDGKYLISNSVQFVAKEFVLRNVQVTTDFSQGTNFKKYKLEDVFVPSTPGGGINHGKAAIKSKGLLWDAIPVTNDKGNTDIWMVKKDLSEFGSGLSWGGMADVLDKDYESAKGDKLALYDRIDKIETEQDLRRIMTSLSGAHYANRAQRGYDIKKGFDNALDIMENSENNTKENVKVTVIGGAGKTYENKEGVMDYKYQTTGVYALREVERTYANKFGYSLGYARNSFEIQDSSESEEKVDTLQLGLHNSYEKNGWKYMGSLTGRVNSHDVERNIKWTDTTENLNDRFMSYGVSLDNTLLKEFHLNKVIKISPLISMDFGYQYFDKVKEDYSISSLEIDSNDAYSIKPGIGVRMDTSNNLGMKNAWALKTGFEVKYEYELGESQKQETARLQTFGDKYKLARPVEDKGELKLKAMLGVEVKDRYGIFLTGEYGKAFNETAEDGESYKVGVTLKAIF